MGVRHSQFSVNYNSRLHRAISRRDEKTTRYLVERAKTDINQIEDGHAPINVALYRRHDAIVDLLIKAGCWLDLGSECECQPLIQTVYMCHTKYIAQILNTGCEVNARDSEGRTSLHVAVSTRNKGAPTIDIIDMLLIGGADVNATDELGQTALHNACHLNKIPEARRLIEVDGCDLNRRSVHADTPLLEATRQGNEQLVRMLAEARCHLDMPNLEGFSALLLAVTLRLHAIMELLLKYGADKNKQSEKNGMSALHYAVQMADAQAVHSLLTTGSQKIEINLVDRQSRTPLLLAAVLGHTDMEGVVELLLASGADVTMCNMEGKTALHLAANYGRLGAARRLLAAGSAVGAEDRTGKTPLLKAAAEGHHDMVRLLLEHRSKVNHRDGQGRTALYLAAQHGCVETIDVLLKAGAMMDLADKEGNAPLHQTVRFPSLHPQSLWQLVQRGCDPINLDSFLAWILLNEILPKNTLFAETGLEEWYVIQRRNPHSLRHLCRVAIHHALRISQRHVPRTKVSQLPLPPSLVDYVSLKLL